MKGFTSIGNNKGRGIGVMVLMVTKYKKKSTPSRNQNKGKATQNSDVNCPTCGKKHGGKPCYREIGACFGCGKQGHMVRDCSKNKKFAFGKPNEENKEDRQKPKAQGRVFAMTHSDAQATSDVVAGTLRIHTLFARALIDPSSAHSFVSVSFSGLLGMSIDNMYLIYSLLLLWENLLCLIKYLEIAV